MAGSPIDSLFFWKNTFPQYEQSRLGSCEKWYGVEPLKGSRAIVASHRARSWGGRLQTRRRSAATLPSNVDFYNITAGVYNFSATSPFMMWSLVLLFLLSACCTSAPLFCRLAICIPGPSLMHYADVFKKEKTTLPGSLMKYLYLQKAISQPTY